MARGGEEGVTACRHPVQQEAEAEGKEEGKQTAGRARVLTTSVLRRLRYRSREDRVKEEEKPCISGCKSGRVSM